ncbi:MAG TPA: hypothetical protein VN408_33215 [Actinoplanes sp.]|nr:hypothetical protein [Actinoplanes sp.]
MIVEAPIVTTLLRGLARNPSAPVEILLELIRREVPPEVLPREVQEAMLAHPSPGIRAALAGNPGIDVDIRGRLLADPECRVAWRAFGAPVSDSDLSTLLTRFADPSQGWLATVPELFGELGEAMRWSPQIHRVAAAHPDPRIRRYAAEVPQRLSEAAIAALQTDPDPEVRQAVDAAVTEGRRVMHPADLPARHGHAFWATMQRPLSRELIDHVRDDEDALYFVGTNPTTPPDVVDELIGHPSATVRQRVAERRDLSTDQLSRLAEDPDAGVRTRISVHPALTEEQRASIGIDVAPDPEDGFCGTWDDCRHRAGGRIPSLDDASRWAGSVNPLLRRRAAHHPGLPSDAVTALAGDTDLGVRVLLARHHPGAPPELLLRCYHEYQGCGRDRLLEHPNFPILELADDPGEQVQRALARSPQLPADRIVALLDDPELGEWAASNPALPIAEMHRILG